MHRLTVKCQAVFLFCHHANAIELMQNQGKRKCWKLVIKDIYLYNFLKLTGVVI